MVNDFLHSDRGVVVFAASTGRQVSMEDPSWGNGAFTKALVEELALLEFRRAPNFLMMTPSHPSFLMRTSPVGQDPHRWQTKPGDEFNRAGIPNCYGQVTRAEHDQGLFGHIKSSRLLRYTPKLAEVRPFSLSGPRNFRISKWRAVFDAPLHNFLAAFQHVVGGKLFDDRHTREIWLENDKNSTVEHGSFSAVQNGRSWPVTSLVAAAEIRSRSE